MVAHLYTDPPDNVDHHRGERALVQHLADLPDDELHLWCSVDFVPGVNDVDLLILHETVGVFVVEVKAVPLTAVASYELESCRIEGRPRGKTPLRQAKQARDQLVSYLQDTMQQPPFVVATACWPKISRAEWNARWPGEGLRRQAEGMIFREDLAEREALRNRLAAIVARPGIGSAPRSRATVDSRVLDDLDATLRGRTSARPPAKPTQTDHSRLRAIERGIAEDQRQRFADGRRHDVVFRGYPGTGKTFRLLQAGLQAARRGEDVLFVCFNKVLAADLSRLVDLTEESFAGSFDIFHAFALVREFCGDQSESQQMGSHEQWAAATVGSYARTAGSRHGFYKTVLVDEAQDLPDWAFTLIESLAAPEVSFFVAHGPGQALYRRDEATWLTNFIKQAKDSEQIIQLNRNYRNSTMEFLTAQCFYQTALRAAEVGRFLAKHGPRMDDQQPQLEIAFESARGNPPIVRRIDTPAADRLDDDDPLRDTELRGGMEPAIRDEITNALAAVRPSGSPSDLLVLVPSESHPAAEWARAALRAVSSVAEGVSYIDYTPNENRETPARPDQIRLCTFHSSRGIEARRVIVVNFHGVRSLPAAVDRSMQNLGYIVLSRANERTTIIVPAGVQADEMRFVEKIIAGVRQVSGDALPNTEARSIRGFQRGDRVSHQRLGLGRVVYVDESSLWIDFGSGKPQSYDAIDEMLEAL